AHPGKGGGVGEVALDIGEAAGEALKHALVQALAGGHNRFTGPRAELLHRPVVAGYADDRAAEEPAGLEPVERAEGHHLRQIPGYPKHDERVGSLYVLGAVARRRLAFGSHCHLVLLVGPRVAGLGARVTGKLRVPAPWIITRFG